jgi:hypothetical protein
MKAELTRWRSTPSFRECAPRTAVMVFCSWRRVSRRSVAPEVEEPATSVPERSTGSESSSGSSMSMRTTGPRAPPRGSKAGRRLETCARSWLTSVGVKTELCV